MRTGICSVLAVVSVVVLWSPAFAEDFPDRVLNLPFGKPLDRDLAKCAAMVFPQPQDYCAVGGAIMKGTRTSTGGAYLRSPARESPNALPVWAGYDKFRLSFDDQGNISGITATTLGVPAQDSVIDSVSMRFGPPSEVTEEPMKDLYGKEVTMKRAQWNKAGVFIHHYCFRWDACTISFSAPLKPQPASAAPRPLTP